MNDSDQEARRTDYLEIDVAKLSDIALRRLCQDLKGSEHPELLLKAKKEFIRRAMKTGLTTKQVVKLITAGRTKENQRITATEWAEPLEITVHDFMRIATGRKSFGS